MRPQRQRLDDIGASAEAAIDHYGQPNGFFQYARHDFQRRHGLIKLSAAVVRKDDPVHAAISSDLGICGRENSFDDQRTFPKLRRASRRRFSTPISTLVTKRHPLNTARFARRVVSVWAPCAT